MGTTLNVVISFSGEEFLEPIHLILQGDEHKRTGKITPYSVFLIMEPAQSSSSCPRTWGSSLQHRQIAPGTADPRRQDPVGGVWTKRAVGDSLTSTTIQVLSSS